MGKILPQLNLPSFWFSLLAVDLSAGAGNRSIHEGITCSGW